MDKKLKETYESALNCFERLSSELMVADEITLTSSQVEIEHLIGYISSLQGQTLELRATLSNIDRFIKIATDTINKAQRSVSQALKAQKGGF